MTIPAGLPGSGQDAGPGPVHFMPIGTDLSMLCEAVELVASKMQISRERFQRLMRVGFAKAGRLLLLLEHYGVLDSDAPAGHPARVLIAEGDVPRVIDGLRVAQAAESRSRCG